jgi:hypothetical protein
MRPDTKMMEHIEDKLLREDPDVIENVGAVLALYPHHPIVRVDGILRWKPKKIAALLREILQERGGLQSLWAAYTRGELPIEELAEFYRDSGYTVGGFAELFEAPLGQKILDSGH